MTTQKNNQGKISSSLAQKILGYSQHISQMADQDEGQADNVTKGLAAEHQFDENGKGKKFIGIRWHLK